MEKKRRLSNSRGWVELTPETLAHLYSPYKDVTYIVKPQRVVIDKLLNDLHEMHLGYIDEAVDTSELKEANEVIKHIMEKK